MDNYTVINGEIVNPFNGSLMDFTRRTTRN